MRDHCDCPQRIDGTAVHVTRLRTDDHRAVERRQKVAQ